MINKQILSQYIATIGHKKILSLWQDFKIDAKQKFEKMDVQDEQNMRLMFHSLKSSSKIFGMEDFSGFCHKIEISLIEQEKKDDIIQQVKQSRKILSRQVMEVDMFLKEIANEFAI